MVLVATQVKRRRGTTAENDAFTGAEGEITVDTEKHELRVHDGLTQGGFKVGSGTGALIIGQMLEVVGTADYTPVGCLLADGAEYTKAQFPNLWADFLTGTPKLQTCTYTEYANQIAEYGFCNKFAVDTTNETFKVPTRNKYRKLVKKIINGSSWANIYDDGWCEQGGKVGGFTHSFSGTYSSSYLATTITLLSFTGTPNINCVSTNGAVYANGEINTSGNLELYLGSANYTASNVYIYWQVSGYIQVPDSTSNITREFVVVANGTLNQEQMDWSAWASSLAGKANIDLSNTPSNIDYVIESQEPTSANGYTWYRKYKSGWVEQGGCYDNGSAVADFSAIITLPVEMADTRYSLSAIASRNTGEAQYRSGFTNIFTQTTTQIGVGWYHGSTSNETMRYINWHVSGISA